MSERRAGAYSSRVLSTFTLLYNHHHHPSRIFHLPKLKLLPFKNELLILLSPPRGNHHASCCFSSRPLRIPLVWLVARPRQ
ncbi:unnamed protein product [Nyctereutes procyonoides]|uniref:(raccoon dog) hypothetical protein n=1 Tax=Nyctereutes procyonoides TaxID=34880 RepID=A0A811Y4T7_NYCPR|nr:unnamed protein product [Nyctereutes procyonoides]